MVKQHLVPYKRGKFFDELGIAVLGRTAVSFGFVKTPTKQRLHDLEHQHSNEYGSMLIVMCICTS